MVTFDGYLLIFCLKSLPPRPWTRTVAGVAVYLTTDENNDGPSPPIKRTAISLIRPSDHIDGRQDRSKMDLVFDCTRQFPESVKIPINEFQYRMNFVVVVLEYRTADLTTVPPVHLQSFPVFICLKMRFRGL